MITVPIVILISGLLLAGLCIPLARGKVPPNRFYGIRTKAAFVSQENWYRINKFGGKVFFGVSIIIALVGFTGFFVPRQLLIAYSIIAEVLVLGSVLGASLIILLRGNK